MPRFCFASMLALIALASAARADDTAAPGADYTYARDIAPILNERCVNCHRPGQIGPMSLLGYNDVRPWVKSIKKAVSERTMPPWFADPAYGKFSNDCRLTDAQVAAIVGWADRGAPAGDLTQAPPPPTFDASGWQIGKPDQVFTAPEFKLGDDVEDLYEHFLIPSNLTEDRYITSMEIRAGAPAAVHHVLVFILPEGKPFSGELGGEAVMNTTFVTGWAPGTNPFIYSEGHGKLLPAKSSIILQVHYHKQPGAGTGVVDQSSFAVKYAEGPVEHPTTTAWIMDPTIAIPPGDPNYEAYSMFRFMDDGFILGMVPHMHLRGKDFMFQAEYPDGRKEILLSVPRYDFNWQIGYLPVEPIAVPKGTVVRCVAHWDNSAANPNNPDPKQTVLFSEKTTDEMMIGFMEYIYKSKKSQQGRFGFPEGVNLGTLREVGERLVKH